MGPAVVFVGVMDGRVAVGSFACVVRDGGNNPGGLACVKGTVRTTSAPLFTLTSKLSSDVGPCVPDVVEPEKS